MSEPQRPLQDQFFIKPGYRHRTTARTLVDDIRLYWTDQRIRASALYQWDVYRRAAEHLASRPARRFADVGSGYPMKIRELIEPLTDDITLFDQPSMAPLMQERFPSMRLEPIDLESADQGEAAAPFECVVCADVIEHLVDPDPLVGFLKRLVAPGGRLYLSTPERDALRGSAAMESGHAEHVREWSFREFRQYLDSRGLDVVEHVVLPPRKLPRLERPLARALSRMLPARYASCQLAICRF